MRLEVTSQVYLCDRLVALNNKTDWLILPFLYWLIMNSVTILVYLDASSKVINRISGLGSSILILQRYFSFLQ